MANCEIRPIPGLNGYYASEAGEIYSKWSQIYAKGKRGPISVLVQDMKTLKQSQYDGRCQVTLSIEGKRKTFRVHHLVLFAFIGPKPQGMEACHFPDSDTKNNKLNNLRWDTRKANQADKVFHGTTNDGERNGQAKLTRHQVINILEKRKNGETLQNIASEFNMSIMAISNICSGKSWRGIQGRV